MTRLILAFLISAAVFALGHPCFSQQTGTADYSNVKLGPEDRLYISIPAEPTLTGEYAISENGKLYLKPLEGIDLGSFQIEGLTLEEARQMLSDRIGKYYNDSTVEMDLITSGVRTGPSITIIGAVGTPGPMRYLEGMKMLDAVIGVRSIAEDANLKRVALIRNGEITYHNLADLVQGRSLSENIPLKMGDTIIFPSIKEKGGVRVHIIGKVNSPGTYMIPEPAQIVSGLTAAGWLYGRAQARNVLVLRMDESGPRVLHVNVGDILNRADLQQNIALRDEDIIFVMETARLDYMSKIRDVLDITLLKRTLQNEF